jgi:hypothetical protein
MSERSYRKRKRNIGSYQKSGSAINNVKWRRIENRSSVSKAAALA